MAYHTAQRRAARLIQCARELQEKFREVENGLTIDELPPADEIPQLRLGFLPDFIESEFRIPAFMTCSTHGVGMDPMLSPPLVCYGVEFVLKVRGSEIVDLHNNHSSL